MGRFRALRFLLLTTGLSVSATLTAGPADWKEWTPTGEAFGTQAVSGSSRAVRRSTGTLTSPSFRVEKPWLTWWMAGGDAQGLRLELLVNGQVQASVRNPHRGNAFNPGGLELRDWMGETVQLRLVDEETAGFDWMEVARIRQSDHPPPAVREQVSRSLPLDAPLMLLPVSFDRLAPRRRLTVRVAGKPVRIFSTSLARDGKGDAWFPVDMSEWQGQEAEVTVDRLVEDSKGLAAIHTASETPGDDRIYRETARPQFHLSPSRGWMGDPNGLVYQDGLWHFFWQHNPYGVDHSNMCWGHAVSRDLFHWTERPVAIYNDYTSGGLGSIYSGGGIIDTQNTGGFQRGEEEVMVLSFFATNHGPALATSHDGGKSFELYADNPVIPKGGWDPKIIWFEPGGCWVMATSKAQEKGKQGVSFYTSDNLVDWTYHSWIQDIHECPELFQLSVDGDSGKRKWMMYGNKGPYFIGEFDGRRFEIEYGPFVKQSGGASQTWSNAPDGRRVEIGKAGAVKGLPFVGYQTLPVEVTLRTRPDGRIRAYKYPVRELEGLRSGRLVARADEELGPGVRDLVTAEDDLLDVVAEFEVSDAAVQAGGRFGFSYRGAEVMVDLADPVVGDVVLRPEEGRVRIRLVVDRVIHEAFFQDGLLYTRGTHGHGGVDPDRTLRLRVEKAPVRLVQLEVHALGKAGWTPFRSGQLIQNPEE